MTLQSSPELRPPDGGAPARRAVLRWAWRLFRREWRQQFLILALVVVAVAATIVGAAVATNSRQPSNFGFGTAQDSATFSGSSAHIANDIARLQRRFGRTEVIANQTLSIPGSIDTYQLRGQRPDGPFSQPMLSLVSGHYPAGPAQVAVTDSVAAAFHLRVGQLWHQAGATRRVVGIVENPQSLLDEFALVAPDQVRTPTQVTVLFDASGVPPGAIGPTVQTPASVVASNPLNPETISLAALVLGMLLIALVSVGGFTVLAQRRLRAIGMLESLGATDRHVGLVVRANGAVVGLVGAVIGFLVSVVVWLAYRPSLEQSAHHLIGVLALPWVVVALALVLAVGATYFAASRPARAITRVPIVAALSGRPAPPKQVRRSAVPGIICIAIAVVLLGYSGSQNGNGGGAGELLLGLVALIPGIILLSPFCLALVARVARRMPITPRLALRDLARYRARSGAALAAISLGVLIAVIVSLAAAARYGNVLDYAGPNLASNQLALQINSQPPVGSTVLEPNGRVHIQQATGPSLSPQALAKGAENIATALGAKAIALKTADAGLIHDGPGRNWNGQLYVGTPQLLDAFGVTPAQVHSNADILTMRPGLSGIAAMQFQYGHGDKIGPPTPTCSASNECLANPVIQQVSALPSGTSAPNTVITEHAVRQFHLQVSTQGWLIQGAHPLTAAQIGQAQLLAASSQLSVESKNDQPSSSEIIDSATLFGTLLALGVIAMSVGLIRSETAGELRTLTAAGVSSFVRRSLTAVTAGALSLIGALLGVVGGYIALIGWLRANTLNGGLSSLGNVPVSNLLVILVGMPLAAAAGGWLLSGRQPPALARQPMQ